MAVQKRSGVKFIAEIGKDIEVYGQFYFEPLRAIVVATSRGALIVDKEGRVWPLN